MEEIEELVSLVPHEHVPRQSGELFVDFPVPQNLKEILAVVRRAAHKHVQQRTDECFLASPVPSIFEVVVEARGWSRKRA